MIDEETIFIGLFKPFPAQRSQITLNCRVLWPSVKQRGPLTNVSVRIYIVYIVFNTFLLKRTSIQWTDMKIPVKYDNNNME